MVYRSTKFVLILKNKSVLIQHVLIAQKKTNIQFYTIFMHSLSSLSILNWIFLQNDIYILKLVSEKNIVSHFYKRNWKREFVIDSQTVESSRINNVIDKTYSDDIYEYIPFSALKGIPHGNKHFYLSKY